MENKKINWAEKNATYWVNDNGNIAYVIYGNPANCYAIRQNGDLIPTDYKEDWQAIEAADAKAVAAGKNYYQA